MCVTITGSSTHVFVYGHWPPRVSIFEFIHGPSLLSLSADVPEIAPVKAQRHAKTGQERWKIHKYVTKRLLSFHGRIPLVRDPERGERYGPDLCQ